MQNRDVPFFSFNNAPEDLIEEWKDSISRVIEKGQFINGEELSKFENSWAGSLGAKFAIGVGNGLDGLTLALEALGIGPGHKVAVPAHTFIATWIAVKKVGATPIGVDANPDGLIDVIGLEKLDVIPDAVIPVHMHGKTCEMHLVMNWAKENKVFVIEDASQAHHSKFEDKYAGTFGDFGIFSLYPSKNLGAIGDSGVVVTDDSQLAEKVRKLANYGSTTEDKYRHEVLGTNSRLDEIQAAVLQVNLRLLPTWNARRVEIAEQYITELNLHTLQKHVPGHVYHHFVILSEKRELLRNFLADKGVGTEIHYPHLASTEFNSFSNLPYSQFPRAEKISSDGLSLPIHQWMSLAEIEKVIRSVREAITVGLLEN